MSAQKSSEFVHIKSSLALLLQSKIMMFTQDYVGFHCLMFVNVTLNVFLCPCKQLWIAFVLEMW